MPLWTNVAPGRHNSPPTFCAKIGKTDPSPELLEFWHARVESSSPSVPCEFERRLTYIIQAKRILQLTRSTPPIHTVLEESAREAVPPFQR